MQKRERQLLIGVIDVVERKNAENERRQPRDDVRGDEDERSAQNSAIFGSRSTLAVVVSRNDAIYGDIGDT